LQSKVSPLPHRHTIPTSQNGKGGRNNATNQDIFPQLLRDANVEGVSMTSN